MLRRHATQEDARAGRDEGVRLQVLDWDCADKSRTMVLLTGLGDNAHVYDQCLISSSSWPRTSRSDGTAGRAMYLRLWQISRVNAGSLVLKAETSAGMT